MLAQQVSQVHQGAVARAVAEAVVDGLEPADVNAQHRHAVASAPRLGCTLAGRLRRIRPSTPPALA
jgi:hypothetical protein